MQIYNTTTNEVETLVYAPNGCDCLADLAAGDQTIKWSEEHEMKAAPAESIKWWSDWIADQEDADTIIEAAKSDLDPEKVRRTLEDIGCDLEDQPRLQRAAILALAEEEGLELRRYEDGSVAFMETEDAKSED